MLKHPCYDNSAHFKYARIHLPVAKDCNILCNYCDRRFCANENRPGVTTRLVSPSEVLEYLESLLSKIPAETTTLGIAGPGEPLFNEETFQTLRIVQEKYSNMFKCVATNGLLLEDRLDELIAYDVTHVTITINAVDPVTASKIYSWINYDGRIYTGIEAGEIMVEKQMNGLRECAHAGILVKVNTVYIPGINDGEIVEIAKAVSGYAYIMNIMPLIPLGKFRGLRRPTFAEVESARRECGRYVRQFYHCKRCRADAYGVPGGVDAWIGDGARRSD